MLLMLIYALPLSVRTETYLQIVQDRTKEILPELI